MSQKTLMTSKIGVTLLMVCTSLATSAVTLAGAALAERIDPTPRIKAVETQNFQNRQQMYRMETLQRQNAANPSRGCR